MFQPGHGSRGCVGAGHQSVPAPQIAFAGDEALTGLEFRGRGGRLFRLDHADRIEPRAQGCGRLDMVGERHAATGQGIGVTIGLVPVPRRALIERGVEIIAQCGRQRMFIARTGANRIEGR